MNEEESEKIKRKKKILLSKKLKENPWILSTLVLGIIAIILLASSFNITGQISKEIIGNNFVDFINSKGGVELKYLSAENFGSSLYEITVLSEGREIPVYITKDGNYFVQILSPITEATEADSPSSPSDTNPQNIIKSDKPENENIETFYDSGEEICFEDGKPIIRMYSSSSCGYCAWSSPMYEKVVNEYIEQGKIVAYLWENNNKDLLTNLEMPKLEKEIFSQYNPRGGVPTFIFGCKYYRVGAPYSRQENGEQLEEEELRIVIDDLLSQ